MPLRLILSAYAGPMPRPVVPIFLFPLSFSLATSRALWYGMIRWAFLLISRLSSNLMPRFAKRVHLFEERRRVHHHAVPDDALLALVQDARGDQVQDELVLPTTTVWPALWPPW